MDLRPEATQCHMKFQHPEGDHFTLINIYKAFKQCQQDPREFREHQPTWKHTNTLETREEGRTISMIRVNETEMMKNIPH